MARDMFLKIDTIDGESTDALHDKWVEIESWSMGVAQPASGVRSTAGSGTSARADFSDLNIMKMTDSATSKLMTACAAGTHIPKVMLECCRASETKNKIAYWKLELEDVVITSVQLGGSGDIPTESVSFNFAKITWTYTPTSKEKGAAATSIPGKWDLMKNQEP